MPIAKPKQLIFIVGFPRSGTTLLQSLMCTQANLCSIPESFFFTDLLPLFQENQGILQIDSASKERILILLEERLGVGFRQKLAISESFQTLKGNYSVKEFFTLFYTIIYDVSGQKNKINQYYWIEKTPDHVHYLEVIRKIFPDAFFIHILRHPVFSVQSATRLFYKGFLLLYYRATVNWLNAQHSFSQFSQQYPNQSYQLYYETLIADPEKILQQLFHHFDLSFNAQALYHSTQEVATLVAEKEKWKQDNFKHIRNKERTIKLRQWLDGSVFIIQYHTGHYLQQNGMKMHNSLVQKYVFNPLYFPIDKGLIFAAYCKRKFIQWLKF